MSHSIDISYRSWLERTLTLALAALCAERGYPSYEEALDALEATG